MPRTMHLMNSSGDVTIKWDEQNDSHVLPVIERMLANGYKFFILTETDQQEPITEATQATTHRRVVITDEGLTQLESAGLLHVGGVTIDQEAETTGETAKTAAEVAENDTVVTNPAAGG